MAKTVSRVAVRLGFGHLHDASISLAIVRVTRLWHIFLLQADFAQL